MVGSGRAPSAASSSISTVAAGLFAPVSFCARRANASLSSIGALARAAPAVDVWCKFRFPTLVISPGLVATLTAWLMTFAACFRLAAAPIRRPAIFGQPVAPPSSSVADSLDPSAFGRAENVLHRGRAPPEGPRTQTFLDPSSVNSPSFFTLGPAGALTVLGNDVPGTSADATAVAATSLAPPAVVTPHPRTFVRASSRRAPHIPY
jgi:hypothetical protein